uniref:FERM domain-containing protein 4A-like isoform X2 n=1 Tax=Myxine glutinosa TaxID=7769 RepID=UPI00358E8D1F
MSMMNTPKRSNSTPEAMSLVTSWPRQRYNQRAVTRGEISYLLPPGCSCQRRSCNTLLCLWCGLGDTYKMTEGRRCHVHLLDGRLLELLVQPKLLAKELLDMVASHFNLKEKEFFGLAFVDETGYYTWLQLDRRVLEHDFPKKSRPIVLHFTVKFYIESVACLRENTTVELFFLNAKHCVSKGRFELDSETAFELAAYVLQEAAGDSTSDESAKSELKNLPPLPTHVLKEHPSLSYCEERVIEQYKKLKGQTRGQAIVNYMSVVETLPSYGVHYYPVKDKKGLPWWLGLSSKGILQYDFQDKLKPRQVFQWRQLENLYFREKKFSIEVHDPRKLSVSRRTFGQSGITIHTWYATSALIKSIWVMAIGQHQFYLDRKQSKSKIPVARSLSEIAIDLTELGSLGTSGMGSMGSESKLISGSDGSLFSSGSQESELSQEAKKDLMNALMIRKEALEETLRLRLQELKQLCLREADLTGVLPREYPLSAGEKAPLVRRRIGTSFKLDEQKLMLLGEEAELERLERDFAIQSQITEAAKRLASDCSIGKKVRKQRKTSYLNALKKLQDIESAINAYRLRAGQEPTKRTSHMCEDENFHSDVQSDGSSLAEATMLNDEDSPRSSLLSSLLSPQRLMPPTSILRPCPPRSLEGLRRLRSLRGDPREPMVAGASASRGRNWAEVALDEAFDQPHKVALRHALSSPSRDSASQSTSSRSQGSASLQCSPVHSGLRWDSCSVPSTPDMRLRSVARGQHRGSFDLSPSPCQPSALHLRQRSCSLESQSQALISDNVGLGPGLPHGMGSDVSDFPMDDHSSSASQSSGSEPGGFGARARPGQTFAELGATSALAANLQRHRSAESLAADTTGEVAPGVNGRRAAAGLYRQPPLASQYRVKEYPLYTDRADMPQSVVRSLESDKEGHYCVKAQVRASHSYTAGGLYRERMRPEGSGKPSMTQSRSQVVRGCCQDLVQTPPSTIDHLRSWYERNSHRRLSHGWTETEWHDGNSPQQSPASDWVAVAHVGGGSNRQNMLSAYAESCEMSQPGLLVHQHQHSRYYPRLLYPGMYKNQANYSSQPLGPSVLAWHGEELPSTARLT